MKIETIRLLETVMELPLWVHFLWFEGDVGVWWAGSNHSYFMVLNASTFTSTRFHCLGLT